MSGILPPNEGESTQISLRIPKLILQKVDVIAKATRYGRTDVMLHFLRWAIREYEAEQAGGAKPIGEKP